ncbi:MAG: hypothetical protein GTO14_17000 [Anaerolineales bacterium]|nr:hypothetical protein [Anaerolineales bacterium]
MSRHARFITLLLALSFLILPSSVAAQNPVVHAVLFYSPTCPHCHKVIEQDLPPLWEIYGGEVELFYIPPTPEEEQAGPSLVGIYGERMTILYVNTYTDVGSSLFGAAVETFNIPPEEQVVPTLIVGQIRLIGSTDIPQQFPDIIEQGLAQGGIDWPEIPGLRQEITNMVPFPLEEPSPEPTPEASPVPVTETVSVETDGPSSTSTSPAPATSTPESPAVVPPVDFASPQLPFVQRFRLDPVGNSLSVLVLVGMILSVLGAAFRLGRDSSRHTSRRLHWSIPLLSLAGIAVAGYLAYIEITGSEAACGPIGDCNTVNQSEYARLFGIIPVGGLGFFGYVAILVLWFIAQRTSDRAADLTTVAILGTTILGTLFSIYLTFLEPFVIGATCAWCLSSAIIITVQMLLSVDPATIALSSLRKA